MTAWLAGYALVVSAVVWCGPVHRRTEVPEDFLIRLQSVQNISQFLNRWVDQAAVHRAYLLQGDDEEAEVEVAHPAGCIPEMQVVEFERPYDPSLVVWPLCTRVRRCGGCCSSKLLRCVPTRKSSVTVKVIKTRYPHPGAEMLELEGYENIRLEQHDRCACQCRQEANDCTELQQYQAGQCRCVCKNQSEATKCKQPDRYWDSRDCTCRCRHELDCSSGSFFDNRSCKCEPVNAPPPVPERVPGPAPHLSALIRDDGGENDAYRLRYTAFDHQTDEGPFALAHYQHDDRTLLLDNITTQTQWTEN